MQNDLVEMSVVPDKSINCSAMKYLDLAFSIVCKE